MRSTLDVDIIADMHLEHIGPLVEALSNGYRSVHTKSP